MPPLAPARSPSTLNKHLHDSFVHARHCDVELRFVHADFEQRLSAHKMVLERSEYFRALFSGPLSGAAASSHSVVLDDPNMTREAVRACISFLYNDELEVASDHLIGSLAMASHLLCPTLERACVVRLSDAISASSIVHLLECGKHYHQPRLTSAAMHWLCSHAWALGVQRPDLFQQLPPGVLADLLGSAELQLPDENEEVPWLADEQPRSSAPLCNVAVGPALHLSSSNDRDDPR